MWAFAGDRVHLWLVAKNSRYEAAAPEHQHRIIPSPTEWYQADSEFP